MIVQDIPLQIQLESSLTFCYDPSHTFQCKLQSLLNMSLKLQVIVTFDEEANIISK